MRGHAPGRVAEQVRAILDADRERRLGMLAEVPRDRCWNCGSFRVDYFANSRSWFITDDGNNVEVLHCPDCGERLPEAK